MRISSLVRGDSIKAMSAPAAMASLRRLTPSWNASFDAWSPPKDWALRASVRAMMTKSGLVRAWTTLRMRSR